MPDFFFSCDIFVIRPNSVLGAFLQFLDLFGDSQAIKKAENQHAKLFLRQKTASILRKRNAANYMSSEKAKYGRSSSASSLQSNVGAYPSSQSQWSGVQPQAWPPTPQTQGQQWNASYAQQVYVSEKIYSML